MHLSTKYINPFCKIAYPKKEVLYRKFNVVEIEMFHIININDNTNFHIFQGNINKSINYSTNYNDRNFKFYFCYTFQPVQKFIELLMLFEIYAMIHKHISKHKRKTYIF